MNDYVSYDIWYIMFMHHQGYLNRYNKIFQDNQSDMMMDMNGRNFCTGNSRHIYIKDFS